MTLLQTIERLEQDCAPKVKIVCETFYEISATNNHHLKAIHGPKIEIKIPQTQTEKDTLKLCAAVRELRMALDFYSKGGNFNLDLWESPGLGHFTGKWARECLSKVDAMFEDKK